MFRTVLKSRWSVVAACLAASSLAGCGSSDGRDKTVPVSGTVTYKGEPLRIGSLVFVPEAGGKTGQANITRDGEYVMGSYEEDDGVIPGKHKVMILALTSPGGSGLPEDSIKGDVAPVSIIPEKYGDLQKSKIVVEVKDGDNKVDFILTDEKAEVKYN